MSLRLWKPVSFAALSVIAVLQVGARADDETNASPEGADEAAQSATDPDLWMKSKQQSAQSIFAGLTQGDFDEVERSARRMLFVNVLEQWLRDEDFTRESDYRGQLNAFEFAAKELVRHAEDENMDGALEAYVQMSQSCVRCHQLIRDPMDAP